MSAGLYSTPADILANAVVSDSPEIMELDQLDALTQIHIVTARLYGYHPVSVRWPGVHISAHRGRRFRLIVDAISA